MSRVRQANVRKRPGRCLGRIHHALPGKQPGWWAVGKHVEHVAGLWSVRSGEEYRAARHGASMAATTTTTTWEAGRGCPPTR